MDRDIFLRTDRLGEGRLKVKGAKHVSVEGLLKRLTDAFGLNERFEPFDRRTWQPIEFYSYVLRRSIESRMLAPDAYAQLSNGYVYMPNELGPMAGRYLEHDGRKLKEVAAIGLATRLLRGDPQEHHREPLHFYDACAGRGPLAILLAHLRGPETMSSDGYEMQGHMAATHEMMRVLFAGGSDQLRFHERSIEEAEYAVRGRTTVLGSKHACGPLSRMIAEAVCRLPSSKRPKRSVILTCCQGLAKDQRPPHLDSVVTDDEWRALCMASDRHVNTLAADDYSQVVGRTAMSVMNTASLVGLPADAHWIVREILSPEQSPKNQAFILHAATQRRKFSDCRA